MQEWTTSACCPPGIFASPAAVAPMAAACRRRCGTSATRRSRCRSRACRSPASPATCRCAKILPAGRAPTRRGARSTIRRWCGSARRPSSGRHESAAVATAVTTSRGEVALELVARLPLNQSWFDASSAAFFCGRPVKMRGNHADDCIRRTDPVAGGFPPAGGAAATSRSPPIRRRCAPGFGRSRRAGRAARSPSSGPGGGRGQAGRSPARRCSA